MEFPLNKWEVIYYSNLLDVIELKKEYEYIYKNPYIDKKEKERLLTKIDAQIDSYIYTRLPTKTINKKGFIEKFAELINGNKKEV